MIDENFDEYCICLIIVIIHSYLITASKLINYFMYIENSDVTYNNSKHDPHIHPPHTHTHNIYIINIIINFLSGWSEAFFRSVLIEFHKFEFSMSGVQILFPRFDQRLLV